METDDINIIPPPPCIESEGIYIDTESDTSDEYEDQYKNAINELQSLVDMSLEDYLQEYQPETKTGLSVEEIVNKSEACIKIHNTNVLLYQGDITKLKIDAIQNAANSSLMSGGGIDGAIHGASGIGLNLECSKLGGCETGNSVITKGYDLPSKTIIHTVGPIYSDTTKVQNKNELISCYKTTLELCEKYKLESIGLCCVSCGIYGFPLEKASHIAFNTVLNHIKENKKNSSLKYIIFVVFMKSELDMYLNMINNYKPIVYLDVNSTNTNNSNNSNCNGLINANSQYLYFHTFNTIAKSGYPCEISLIDGSKVSGEYICTESDNENFIVRNLQTPIGIYNCALIRRCDIMMLQIFPPKEVLDEEIDFHCRYLFNNQ